MSKYVQLGEVSTWYDEHGSGEPLVMFHPGGVGIDSRAFGPNLEDLKSQFKVFLPERRGHGRTADVEGPYTYQLLAKDMIRFIEQVVGGPVRIIGMSDGAVVALLLAQSRQDLVSRLICVAGVFHNNGWLPGVIEPNYDPPEFLIDNYEKVSPDGRQHFSVVQTKLNEMHAEGPKLSVEDLKLVKSRTLVMAGDDDEIAFEHSVDFYRSLPNSELAIVPGTSHGLLVEKPELCNKIMLDFLTTDPVETFAPIRRTKRN